MLQRLCVYHFKFKLLEMAAKSVKPCAVLAAKCGSRTFQKWSETMADCAASQTSCSVDHHNLMQLRRSRLICKMSLNNMICEKMSSSTRKWYQITRIIYIKIMMDILDVTCNQNNSDVGNSIENCYILQSSLNKNLNIFIHGLKRIQNKSACFIPAVGSTLMIAGVTGVISFSFIVEPI